MTSGSPSPPRTRLAIAAAHVVMKESYRGTAHALSAPGDPEAIEEHVDWDATAAIRRRLDALGYAVAEAMDTAQRFSIGWRVAERLVRETGKLSLRNGFVAGAGADSLARVSRASDLVGAVVYQASAIRAAGGVPMLLPLPHLSLAKAAEDEYVDVYGAVIRSLEGPLFVHWLGAAFHPALAGYFPGESFRRILEIDPGKVRGAKVSLLDPALEVAVRRECRARGQIVLTGDDWHFAALIEGNGAADGAASIGPWRVALGDFSHALLGVLDAIARPFSRALAALEAGDRALYRSIAGPCEALGAFLFGEPTRHYKAGLAFLSYLNGLQENFLLVNREDRARDAAHYRKAAALAAACGAIEDGHRAAERLARLEDSLR